MINHNSKATYRQCIAHGLKRCKDCDVKPLVSAREHTPGPWTFRGYGNEPDETLGYEVIGGLHGGERILSEVNLGAGDMEAQANARLIASAPSLVEALQVLVEQADYAQRYQHGENLETLQRVAQAVLTLGKTAIAKAEGR